MHPNRTFRKTSQGQALLVARERSFGTLAVSADAGPLLAHVPFLLAEDGASMDLHLVRSNPVCRSVGPAVMSVLGPDGYVSPDWYGVNDQVPTWNYVAVHLRGVLEIRPDEELRDTLERQSAHFEGLLPKTPWTTDKMSDGVMEAMMRAIVPATLHIEKIDSTFKLNQNKPDEVRLRAAAAIADGVGERLGELARLMQTPPE